MSAEVFEVPGFDSDDGTPAGPCKVVLEKDYARLKAERDALLEECEAASRWMREIAEGVDLEIPAEEYGPEVLESLRLAVIGNIEMAKIEIERLTAPMSINEIKIGAVRFNQIISERLAAITKATREKI